MLPNAIPKLLKAAKAPAFLITNPVNIRYVTGAEVSVGAVLLAGKTATLFVDSRYTEKAASQIYRHIRLRTPEELSKTLEKTRRVAFEGDFVTCATHSKWQQKFKNTKFVQKDWMIEDIRRSKTESERKAIRTACTITKKILAGMPTLLKKGFTERELAVEIERIARKMGAEGMAFDSIVAFGEHTSRPHHSPTDRRLKKTDIVQIDMGVKVDGYCSDYSRVYFVSAPTSEQRKAYRALTKAKKMAERAMKPGITNRELDAIARSSLKAAGYDKEFSHSLGHGVGLEIHEGINLSGKAPIKKLLKHEVITIEPGLYFPGKWGMRLEDTHII